MSDVIELTAESFASTVANSAVPVLVDFWAPRCGPCRIIAPTIEALAAEAGDKFKICKLNVDDHPAAAMNYNIASIPTLLVFSRGVVNSQLLGVQSKEKLLAALEEAT